MKKIIYWLKQFSEKTRTYSSEYDYVEFDLILECNYRDHKVSSLDEIFKWSFYEYYKREVIRKKIKVSLYDDNGIDRFAKDWRSWAKQTGKSFWKF